MTTNDALAYLNNRSTVPDDQKHMLKRWKDVYYSMSLHTTGARPRFKSLQGGKYINPPGYYGPEYQRLFEDILFSRHPRENEETRWWRFSQYKPITRAPFLQIIEVITGAIFQDSNYSVSIPDPEDSDYMLKYNNFDNYDLVGWFANIAVACIMEDPNGLIVRIPSKPYYEVTEAKTPVSVWFVNSKDIVYFSDANLIFRRDNYAYWIDHNTIFRFTLDASSKTYSLTKNDANGYYATLLGKLPVDIAGGVWNTQKFWDSYLVKAQATADDYISSYSAEQMIDKEAAHPFIIQADEECAVCHGNGQIQVDCDECDGGLEMVSCNVCHGKGTTSVSPGDRMNVPAEQMKNDLIKIVNPDVNINDYHHKKNNDIFQKILDALNLVKVQQPQSGKAKAIDQERLYQFVSKIANNLFDKLIFNTIGDIISYRNAVAVNGSVLPAKYPFSITKPTQYQIKTAADLLTEYMEGVKGGIPIFVRQQMALDFVDKQYSGDAILKKMATIILSIDALAVCSEDEKLTKATNGEVTKEDLVFSLRLPQILKDIVAKGGEEVFLRASDEQLKIKIDAAFEVFKPKPLVDVFADNTA